MALNYLYHRHQVSLFLSENGASAQSRAAHLGLAEGYASRIDAVKQTQQPLEALSKLEIIA
jgi:hypothetical protein